MADKKISQLTNLTGANLADNDEFVLVDTSADETKAITFGELKTAFDTGTGFVRVTGDTMTGALNVQSTITSDGLTVDGDITATGGDVNLDTLDLNAIAATIADTAVDVFVYDTSKDSDGGAWRKRTQGTSWYNETLNTATRGSRREFPAVAVIVAESNKVTIYDGDDPALPMWMVFLGSAGNMLYGGSVSSISAINGSLLSTSTVYATNWISFVSDDHKQYATAGNRPYLGSIEQRNENLGVGAYVAGAIVNNTVNDVAMTVLPNAPIDAATGLPVPTIAVATDGGVSVIKDDGTVASDSHTVYVQRLAIIGSDLFSYIQTSTGYVAVRRNFHTRTGVSVDNFGLSSGGEVFYRHNSTPALFPAQANNAILKFDSKDFGFNQGLFRLHEDEVAPSKSMVAYTTSTYNTGWMNGAIKGAFLSDTDDTDLVGSGELVTNGTFDTDVSGWIAAQSGTLTVNSGRLEIANSVGGSSGAAYQTIPTIVGRTYTASFEEIDGTSATNIVRLGANGFGTLDYYNLSNLEPGTYTISFVATSVAVTISLYTGSVTASETALFDNISVKLADADRSVNNNGLIVNGTVIRSPVATGADLVAYSGFSASNYLEQPYNSALDFGTGDFCVMGWFKTSVSGTDYIVHLATPGSTSDDNSFYVYIDGSGYLAFATRTGSASLVTAATAFTDNVWRHFCAVRTSTGTIQSIYINGVLHTSASVVARSIDTSTQHLFVASRADAALQFAGSLALLRISATAPTAEQIKKIYEDEKVLFQENAQATLYGASDAVTALAHDDATNLLHVGTSAGRSVFQGLRRVSNTTTAVGTAISASNGLVVEE